MSHKILLPGLVLLSLALVTCSPQEEEKYPNEGFFETESGFFKSYFPYPPEVEVEYGPNKTLVKETMLTSDFEQATRSGHILLYGEREESKYVSFPEEVLSSFGINTRQIGRSFKHEPTGLKAYKVEGDRFSGSLLVDERKNLTIYSFGREETVDSLILKDRSLSGVKIEYIINIKPEIELESGWDLIRQYDNFSDTLHFAEMEATIMDSTLGTYSLIFAAENCYPKELLIDTRGAHVGGNTIYTNELDIKMEKGENQPRPPLGKLSFNSQYLGFLWEVY
ncbi:hypothetical protein [Halocola ammonii]